MLSANMTAVFFQGLLTGFLVMTLMVGAFLILNLGLLSKRAEDRIGGRTPSDVGLLKSNVWPEAPYEQDQLPARSDVPKTKKLKKAS